MDGNADQHVTDSVPIRVGSTDTVHHHVCVQFEFRQGWNFFFDVPCQLLPPMATTMFAPSMISGLLELWVSGILG